MESGGTNCSSSSESSCGGSEDEEEEEEDDEEEEEEEEEVSEVGDGLAGVTSLSFFIPGSLRDGRKRESSELWAGSGFIT